MKQHAMDGIKLRSAEKTRSSSTCKLADRIAEVSINAFKNTCPVELQNSYKQTVIASIVLQEPAENRADGEHATNLKVVSLGAGTKVLPSQVVESEKLVCSLGGSRIRDMHAEVLARRGFKRYLLEHLIHLVYTCRNEQNITDFIAMHNNRKDSIFHIHQSDLDGTLTFQWNPTIKIHLYSSSQPCGNACIKKWAKSKAPQFRVDLSADEFPTEIHEPFHVTARSEGQIALLVKKNNPAASLVPSNAAEWKSKYTLSAENIPAGTAFTDTAVPAGNIMTCSDKIARWNVLGLQGGLLCRLITQPIYLNTITVGRKFSQSHGQRAFCCRLSSFPPFSLTGGTHFALHHPVVMGTTVKFDHSVIVTDMTGMKRKESDTDGSLPVESEPPANTVKIGAQFDEFRCFVGWMDSTEEGVYHSEVLDGHTGYRYQQTEQQQQQMSQVCSQLLTTTFLQLQQLCMEAEATETTNTAIPTMSYGELKKQVSEDYQVTKNRLLHNGQGEYFDEWTKKSMS